VSVDGVIGTLSERELVEVVGRADAPGRPRTYGTTQLFLEYFGLRGLEELPDAEELRQVPITRPAAPVTTGADEDAPEQMSLEEVTGEEDEDDDEDDEDEKVEEASQTS
jgi:segregation and condensation protein B